LLVGQAAAETLVEHSAETRLQLDFAVGDAAIRKVLPPGWDTDVATSGGAKDCNLRMIFIDRIDVTAPDDAAKGTRQLVYLEVPIRSAPGRAPAHDHRWRDRGLKDAPGPFGVYKAAVSHRMERSTPLPPGADPNRRELDFTAANGEHMELHLKPIARRRLQGRRGEIKFFSGKSGASTRSARSPRVSIRAQCDRS
jgi:hypothetical protein